VKSRVFSPKLYKYLSSKPAKPSLFTCRQSPRLFPSLLRLHPSPFPPYLYLHAIVGSYLTINVKRGISLRDQLLSAKQLPSFLVQVLS
jgi:hypothetical protein